MKLITKSYQLMAIILLITGCATTSSDHKDDHGHENESQNEEEVHLVEQQMNVMDIQLGHFQYLNLSTTVKANGQLELPPQNEASVSTILGGRIRNVKGIEGDYVVKGQVLAFLEHPDFITMQEEYAKNVSRMTFLEAEMKRSSVLYKDSISSAREYQQTQAEFNEVRAKVSSLEAQLKMMGVGTNGIAEGQFRDKIPVSAPISGYLRKVYVNMGKYVVPHEVMFEIVDNEHIHIDLRVYEKDMNKIKKDQKVAFSLTNQPDSVFEGKVFAVGKSFENEPKAMIVHAEIDNKTGDLLPGMYVDARIITNEHQVRSLPDDAIVSDGGLNYIFALRPGGAHQHEDGDSHSHEEQEYIFRKIEVNLGASDIGFTEVVPAYNIPDKVQIVTKGAYYLLAEMKKGEGGHGHHH